MINYDNSTPPVAIPRSVPLAYVLTGPGLWKFASATPGTTRSRTRSWVSGTMISAGGNEIVYNLSSTIPSALP